jgi:hypothetical protein
MYHGVIYNRFSRVDTGELESSNIFIIIPDWHFNSGDSLHALLSPDIVYERLFAPFEISPGVILPPGEYRFTRWSNNVATAGTRRLQARIQWLFGTFWSGHADEWQTSGTYKLPPHFTVTLAVNQTFARLPQGDFSARIATVTANYAASPFLALSNLIQYDNRSRNLSWQARVRWTLQPGNDLFFVVNQGWIQEPGDRRFQFNRSDTQLSTKLQYTHRL